MSYAMEVGLYPHKSADHDASWHRAAWDIGATGAPTAQSYNSPEFTITRSSAGIYTLTFPKSYLAVPPIISLVTDTVVSSKTTAFDAQAGTATIELMDAAGAAVEAANGDELHLLIYMVSTVTG